MDDKGKSGRKGPRLTGGARRAGVVTPFLGGEGAPGPAKRKPALKAPGTPARLAAPQQQRRPAPVVVRPMATPARVRTRHWGLLAAFLAVAVLPPLLVTGYLYLRAVDQYASTLGFTVRQEESAAAVDLLGGLGALGGGAGASSDSDILYEYIQSQELVSRVDGALDLRSIWSVPHDEDPILAFDPTGTIEDLVAYWQRMVQVYYDPGTGLTEVRVLAFAPDDAREVADAIFAFGSEMINGLSEAARRDATRYAEEDLELALERLKSAREAVTEFRLGYQIVDPTADIQGQVGLLSSLQAQLADAFIAYDELAFTARAGDPRLDQAQRRIEVIEARIAEEREKFGAGGEGPGGEDYATIFAEYERLQVDRQFAEASYTAALTALDAARAEAQRQSRYLAAYVTPTTAEKSEYPRRPVLIAITALFGLLAWSIVSLIYYSLRDRG